VEIPEGVESPSGVEIPEGVELSNGGDSSASQAQLESMTVKLLREKLRDAGMPVSGRKSDLIRRLLDINEW
jgi:hypothetical protein